MLDTWRVVLWIMRFNPHSLTPALNVPEIFSASLEADSSVLTNSPPPAPLMLSHLGRPGGPSAWFEKEFNLSYWSRHSISWLVAA